MYVIRLKNISKVFKDQPGQKLIALKNITLDIEDGEFFIFVGSSGCGKSTLLRIMSGLEKDYEGEINIGGGLTASDFSFVFQQFALLPWLTVHENIELGLIARKTPEREREHIVARELKVFGLEKFAKSYPKELSGGMRQRVGIARALATNPKVIFMDEPFSELDTLTAEELRQELLRVWAERQPTFIMVSHNMEESLELASRIAVMTPRPGEIKKVVVNDLPRPRAKRSEAFYRLEDELNGLMRQ